MAILEKTQPQEIRPGTVSRHRHPDQDQLTAADRRLLQQQEQQPAVRTVNLAKLRMLTEQERRDR